MTIQDLIEMLQKLPQDAHISEEEYENHGAYIAGIDLTEGIVMINIGGIKQLAISKSKPRN